MKTSKVLNSVGNAGLFTAQKSIISVAYTARGIRNVADMLERSAISGASTCLAKRKNISKAEARDQVFKDFDNTLNSMSTKANALAANFKRTPKPVAHVAGQGIR